jgi:transcriptional regulator with XRE-family HTH domain
MTPLLINHKPAARFSRKIRTPCASRRKNNLELAIGHEVRAFRKKLGITGADLAAATGISLGMLSKIENGNISPSPTTLQSLSRALGVPLTAFFRRFEEPRNAVFVKAVEGVELNAAVHVRVTNTICWVISTTIRAALSSSPI